MYLGDDEQSPPKYLWVQFTSLASTTYGVCPSSVLPNLDGVDDVLPEDITARADGGEGIKIGIGHPDGEGGVLLS